MKDDIRDVAPDATDETFEELTNNKGDDEEEEKK